MQAGTLLGKGSYGKVKTGIYQNRVVAMKKFFDAQDNYEVIVNEIAALATLASPLFLNVEYENHTPTRLILELYEGTLKDIITLRVLSHQLVHQLLVCVMQAHDVGIIHRDIKPGNILYRRTGGEIELILADWGTALYQPVQIPADFPFVLNELESYCEAGTTWYKAPELLAEVVSDGPCYYSFATDMWSVGLVMVQLLLGELEPLVHADTLSGQMNQMIHYYKLNQHPDVRGPALETHLLQLGLSSEDTGFVLRVLHSNPEQRWSARRMLGKPELSNLDRLYNLFDPPNIGRIYRVLDLIPVDRSQVVEWLIGLAGDFRSKEITYFSAVHLLDRCLSQLSDVGKHNLALIGCGCLYLSECMYQNYATDLWDYAHRADLNRDDLYTYLEIISEVFGFQLYSPSIYEFFLERIVQVDVTTISRDDIIEEMRLEIIRQPIVDPARVVDECFRRVGTL